MFVPRLTRSLKTEWRLFTLRKIEIARVNDNPAMLVLQWLLASLIHIADFVLLPADGSYQVGTILLVISGVLLSSFLAAWIAGRKADAIRFGMVFMRVAIMTGLLWAVALMLPFSFLQGSIGEIVMTAVMVWWAAVICAFVARASDSPFRWGWAILATLISAGLVQGAHYTPWLDSQVAYWIYESHYDEDAEHYPSVYHETLWPAQPVLVEASLAKIAVSRASGANTYIVSVAAGGSQDLFGREAGAVQSLLARRFGSDAASALLSNAEADLEKVPMANAANLSAILTGVGKSFDPGRDLAIVYLTAHGGRDATLQTDLPDYSVLRGISAKGLAAALDKAGIRRRVVIISACYSGSWIAPLKSPDTIVLTAAAADRTSFGCDDSRDYTVFGDALLNSGLGGTASLHQAFDALKRRVAKEEAASKVTPSLPQVFVGANMKQVWEAGTGSEAE